MNQSNYTNDIDLPHDLAGEKFNSTQTRHNFIFRVYNILSLQLLFTFGLSALFITNQTVQDWVQVRPGLIWIGFIFMFGILITMACNPKLGRQKPTNYILLSLLTGIIGYTIAVITTFYKANAVVYAAGITTVITLGLSLFACQTKYDFTGMGGYLMGGLLALLGAGLIMAILCGRGDCETARTVYAWLGATIFAMYIVYDTQLIMGGGHRKYQFDEQDHVFAAIALYLDIVNLVLYILEILGGGGRRDN